MSDNRPEDWCSHCSEHLNEHRGIALACRTNGTIFSRGRTMREEVSPPAVHVPVVGYASNNAARRQPFDALCINCGKRYGDHKFVSGENMPTCPLLTGFFALIKEPEAKAEQVNHPAHYGGEDNPYEAIKVIEAWKLGFNLGGVLKYIAREQHKGGLQDLEKAAWYLAREIANRKAKAG